MSFRDFVLPYHIEAYRGLKTGSDTETLGWRLNIIDAEGFIVSGLAINQPDNSVTPAYYFPTKEEALAAWNKPRVFEAVTSSSDEALIKWQSDLAEWVRHPDVNTATVGGDGDKSSG